LYLLLVLLNFSQSIPQIIELVLGWVFFAAGISYIIPLKKGWKKLREEKSKVIGALFYIVVCFIMTALFFGLSFAPQLFVKH